MCLFESVLGKWRCSHAQSKSEWEREREIFYPMIYIPEDHKGKGRLIWLQEPGTAFLFQGLPCACSGSRTWAILLGFPGHISGEMY